MTSTYKYLCVLLFLLITTVNITKDCYAVNEFDPRSFFIDQNYKTIQLTNGDNYNTIIGSICSVEPITENIVLVANYAQIIKINLDTGKTKILEKPLDVNKWVPTGLKWNKKTQRLYLANYLAKDVLVLKIDEDKLVLEKRITDDELVGPENIDVSDDGKLIAVADYNNSKLITFSEAGKKLWSRDIAHAHGVIFSSDQNNIFVSGLRFAKIYKFSLDGKLINETGQKGFGHDSFLWPVGLTRDDKYIYISDAHTGKITKMDYNLHTVKTYGGNGLGENLFNMPYAATFINENLLLVADTFKSRLALLDLEKDTIMVSYDGPNVPVFMQDNKVIQGDSYALSPYIPRSDAESIFYRSTGFDKIEPLGLHYKERLDTASSFIIPMSPEQEELFHGKWKVSYAHIESDTSDILPYRVLSFDGAYNYFTSTEYYWILSDNFKVDNKQYIIIGSPQNYVWIVGRAGFFLPICIGHDYWLYKGSLCSSKGKCIKYKSLAELTEKKISAAKRIDLKHTGLLTVMDSLYRFVGNDMENMFVSAEGKEYIKKVKADSSDPAKIYNLSLDFLKKLDKESVAYFPELMFASTIFALTQNPKDASN
jgi:DNA-binding beta-propeller fold protein YncE